MKTVPIRTAPEERLDGKWFEDRVLLIAVLDVKGTDVTVMVCHFGLNPLEGARATETVLREAEKITSPLLFMGDLNLTPQDENIKKIASVLTDTARDNEAQLTFPAHQPKIKIDYIFVKNCTATTSQVPPIIAADHRPYRAEIEL